MGSHEGLFGRYTEDMLQGYMATTRVRHYHDTQVRGALGYPAGS